MNDSKHRLNISNHVTCIVNPGAKIFEEIFLMASTQSAFTCSKLTIETLEQDVKYVQS